MEDDQEVVEAIQLDCQDEPIGEAADDGECGGGESSKSDGSKRQDSGDTDDDLEGEQSFEDKESPAKRAARETTDCTTAVLFGGSPEQRGLQVNARGTTRTSVKDRSGRHAQARSMKSTA